MDASERKHLPRIRQGRVYKFHIGEGKGYLTTGEYEDGTLGEVFLRVTKQGSTLSGAFDSVALLFSHGLQHGIPVVDLCKALINLRYEPFGDTDDPSVPKASSISDYVARRLALDYCNVEDQSKLFVAAELANNISYADSGSTV